MSLCGHPLLKTGATVAAHVPTPSGVVSVMEIDEDKNVQVCVRLTNIMSGLERDVIVNLNTVPGTARE